MTDIHGESAAILRLLAHPARLLLLEALLPGEECVCHLTALLGRRQAYVSQHLAALRQAGLVSERKEGLRVYYRIGDPRVAPLLAACRKSPAKRHVRTRLASCPCPHCARARQKGN